MLNSLLGIAKEFEQGVGSLSPRKSASYKERKYGRKNNGKESLFHEQQYCRQALSPLPVSEDNFAIRTTKSGVEIALDNTDTNIDYDSQVELLNYHNYTRKAIRVHRCQYSINFPMIPVFLAKKNFYAPQSQHRLPFQNEDARSSISDEIFLLQSHTTRDEMTSVAEEVSRLDKDIRDLENFRLDIEHEYFQQPIASVDLPLWDVNFLLHGQKLSIDVANELQRRRGRCWTVQLRSMKLRDTLCSKLNSQDLFPSKHTNKYKFRATVTAITQVSHMCLLPLHGNTSAFFVHTDTSESFGHVPAAILSRMKKSALQIDMLTYMAMGPNESYYVAFSSGHVFWASSDSDFHAIVRDWPVYRVAFGESKKLPNQKMSSSWIVVARDGRVAFKNLPQRLTNILNSRLVDMPMPSEVALGSDGSYFIRFLDGVIEYCLPSDISNVCEFVLRRGGKITNVLLHPKLSKEFIVRHTEMK
jgi:hypothetical protein